MHSTFTNIAHGSLLLLLALVCAASASASTPYYVLHGYNNDGCLGAPLSLTVVNTTCNPAGASHPFLVRNIQNAYEYSECTEAGLKIFQCTDSDCTNCTEQAQEFAVNTCSSGGATSSSQTKCETQVPSFPERNYRTLTTFTDDNCDGAVRSEYFEAITLDTCTLVRGFMTYYTKDVCSENGTYVKLRCSDDACEQCSPLSIYSGCSGSAYISCIHAGADVNAGSRRNNRSPPPPPKAEQPARSVTEESATQPAATEETATRETRSVKDEKTAPSPVVPFA